MSITFSGLASGMDTDSIVKDLMALERAPLERMTAKKDDATQRLEAFAQFKSKLDSLKSAVGDMTITSQVRSTSVSLSSEDSFTATTSSSAIGSYNVSVAQLSQVQKSITGGFSSNTDAIFGTGTITVNGMNISITEENNSLLGLVNSINKVAESTDENVKTTGVRASIINDGSATNPYHIVFTGKDAKTTFEIDASGLSTVASGDIAFETGPPVQTAQQAVVIIDGITVTSDTNTISGAINGVTLNLNSVDTFSGGTPETDGGTPPTDLDPWNWTDPPVYDTTKMDVKADTEPLKEKVTAFVTAYNDVMDWILSGYEEFGGTSEVSEDADEDTLLGSVLRGDATINSMKRQLQGVLTNTVKNGGSFRILSEIGIGTNLNGTLKQDNTELDKALENNFDDVVYLISGDDKADGVMKEFNSLLLDMTSSTQGVYAVQKKSYDSAVKDFDSKIAQMEQRMTKREQILRSQFTMMESLVSSLNAQGDFLTQQMDALNRNN